MDNQLIPVNAPDIDGDVIVVFSSIMTMKGISKSGFGNEDAKTYPATVYSFPKVTTRAGRIRSVGLSRHIFPTSDPKTNLELLVNIAKDGYSIEFSANFQGTGRELHNAGRDTVQLTITTENVYRTEPGDGVEQRVLSFSGGIFTYVLNLVILEKDYPKLSVGGLQLECKVGEEVYKAIHPKSWATAYDVTRGSFSSVDSMCGPQYGRSRSIIAKDGSDSGLRLSDLMYYDEEAQQDYQIGWTVSGTARRPGVYFLRLWHKSGCRFDLMGGPYAFPEGESSEIMMIHIRPETPMPGDLVVCMTQDICTPEKHSLQVSYAELGGYYEKFDADMLTDKTPGTWAYHQAVWDNSFPSMSKTDTATKANDTYKQWLAGITGDTDAADPKKATLETSAATAGDAAKHTHLAGYWTKIAVWRASEHVPGSTSNTTFYYYYVITRDVSGDGQIWRMYSANTASDPDAAVWHEICTAPVIPGLLDPTPPRYWEVVSGDNYAEILFRGSSSYTVTLDDTGQITTTKVNIAGRSVDYGGTYGYIGRTSAGVDVFQQQPTMLPDYAGDWQRIKEYKHAWETANGKPDPRNTVKRGLQHAEGLLLANTYIDGKFEWRLAFAVNDFNNRAKSVGCYAHEVLHVAAAFNPMRPPMQIGHTAEYRRDVGFVPRCLCLPDDSEDPTPADPTTADCVESVEGQAMTSISNWSQYGWRGDPFAIGFKDIAAAGIYWHNYPFFRFFNCEHLRADISVEVSAITSSSSGRIVAYGYKYGDPNPPNASSAGDGSGTLDPQADGPYNNTTSSNTNVTWKAAAEGLHCLVSNYFVLILCRFDNSGVVNGFSGSTSTSTSDQTRSKYYSVKDDGTVTASWSSQNRSSYQESSTLSGVSNLTSYLKFSLVGSIGSGLDTTAVSNDGDISYSTALSCVFAANIGVEAWLAGKFSRNYKSSYSQYGYVKSPAYPDGLVVRDSDTDSWQDANQTFTAAAELGCTTGLLRMAFQPDSTACTIRASGTAQDATYSASGQSGIVKNERTTESNKKSGTCTMRTRSYTVSGRTRAEDVVPGQRRDINGQPVVYPLINDINKASYRSTTNGRPSSGEFTGTADKVAAWYAKQREVIAAMGLDSSDVSTSYPGKGKDILKNKWYEHSTRSATQRVAVSVVFRNL